MAAWVNSSVGAIVLAIRTHLVTRTALDDTRVVVTVLPPEDVPLFGAAQDVLVRVMGEEPREAVIDGAGRWDDRRVRRLEIAARTRVSLDAAGQDLTRLTHASLGHLALEDAVVGALEVWSVTSGGDALTAPLRVGRIDVPTRLRQDGKLTDWLYSKIVVELEYRRDLDTSLSAQFDP